MSDTSPRSNGIYAMMDEDNIVSLPADLDQLLLIVVGSHLRAEMADRPLAYRLRRQIIDWTEENRALMDPDCEPLVPVVCSDIWYLNQQELQRRPVISIGGGGVNVLSGYLTRKLPYAMGRDDEMMVQLDGEYIDLRVCLWGVDNDYTAESVALFEDQYLEQFLRAVVTQVEPQLD